MVLCTKTISSASQETPRRKQWNCRQVILKDLFYFTSVVLTTLQSLDRCRNIVQGQSRYLCAIAFDTGIPGLCPGVFLQKIVYIQHAGSGSTPKRESAMKQALIPDRSHRTLSPVSIVSLTQKSFKRQKYFLPIENV